MTAVAYRVAGVFCCLVALCMLGAAIYYPFYTIMAPPGKVIAGVGGAFSAIVAGYVGIKFIVNGGPA